MSTVQPVVGHAALRARLEQAWREDTLGHALLLSGPHGVGKTTCAVDLAARLLDAPAWPGGLLAHPDLWMEDSDSERIGIDRVRPGVRGDSGPSLQEMLALRPYAGGMRVAIVARAERLTEQAANSLLKTLEEPPPSTLIVLCASTPERLPPTVISRLQHLPLTTVPIADIAAWLIGRGVHERLAGLASALSGGRPGRAVRLATEPGALHAELTALHAFLAIAGGGVEGALRAAAELAPSGGADGRERALLLLAVWASFVRDALCEATAASELRVWLDYTDAVERWAESLGPQRLTAILALLVRATGEISQYAHPRLTLDALFLDIFVGPQSPPPLHVPPQPVAASLAPQAETRPARMPPAATPAPARRR